MLRQNLAQHQRHAQILQNILRLIAALVKNPVGKPVKAQHINIKISVKRMCLHQLPLHFQTELFRNDDITILFWILSGQTDGLLQDHFRLALAAAARNDSQCHIFSPVSRPCYFQLTSSSRRVDNSSSSGTFRTIFPFLMRRPSPTPPAMPMSASLASPGPLTTQPMTATLIFR